MSTENSKAKLACIWLIFLFIHRARCSFFMSSLFGDYSSPSACNAIFCYTIPWNELKQRERTHLFQINASVSNCACITKTRNESQRQNNSKQKPLAGSSTENLFRPCPKKSIKFIERHLISRLILSIVFCFSIYKEYFRLLCSQLAKVLSKWNFSRATKKLVH